MNKGEIVGTVEFENGTRIHIAAAPQEERTVCDLPIPLDVQDEVAPRPYREVTCKNCRTLWEMMKN